MGCGVKNCWVRFWRDRYTRLVAIIALLFVTGRLGYSLSSSGDGSAWWATAYWDIFRNGPKNSFSWTGPAETFFFALLTWIGAELAALSGDPNVSKLQAAKDRIRELETSSDELKRYKMKDLGGDTFAYALRPECKGESEQDHLLCPGCYDKKIKGLLQRVGDSHTRPRSYRCVYCDARHTLGENPPLITSPDIKRRF